MRLNQSKTMAAGTKKLYSDVKFEGDRQNQDVPILILAKISTKIYTEI